MNLADEFKEAVKYAWENPPLRMVENGSAKAQKALKAYLKLHPGIIDDQLEKYPGYTLLHIAARRGNFGAAKILVEHGADIRQTTGSGVTPLALALLYCDENAKWEERQKLASLLLDKGADIEARFGNEQRTLLQETFCQNQEKEARFLLAKGADPQAAPAGDARMTPLMECLRVQNGEAMLDLGLEHGMDATAENTLGMTALCYAKTASAALKLIEAGADPAHTDSEGYTALSYLPSQEREKVEAKLLSDAGHLSAARDRQKARQDAALDAACHTPVETKAMKPLKLKKPRAAR